MSLDNHHLEMGMAAVANALHNARVEVESYRRDAERYRWLRERVRLFPADSWSEALKLSLPEFYEKEGIKFAIGGLGGHLDFVIDANIQERSDAACPIPSKESK